MHHMTGCLCEPCEQAIEGMSQEQLDEDYRAHTAGRKDEPTRPA